MQCACEIGFLSMTLVLAQYELLTVTHFMKEGYITYQDTFILVICIFLIKKVM